MIVGILLAAGTSKRFGVSDKLLHMMDGKPMVAHAADAMRGAQLDHKIAVIRSQAVATLLPDFECLDLSAVAPQMATSVKSGITRAQELGADKVLVHLADMPFVDANVLNLVTTLCTDKVPSAVRLDHGFLPPVCFPKQLLPQLHKMSGDEGARKLLARWPNIAAVEVPAQMLVDVDTRMEADGLEQKPKQL
ncbi:MAG: nucleotidyltransferase family protein [Pseudomonadota bacterium]